MKRSFAAVGVAALVALTAGAVVLSYASTRTERAMVGLVAAKGAVVLETHDQLGVQGGISIDRVVVPRASWIAVYTEGMDGMPGTRAGLVHVPAGESANVLVDFDPEVRLTESAIVVVHADAGVANAFEYSEDRFESSPDKPYWVAGAQVQRTVWVRFYEMGNSFKS